MRFLQLKRNSNVILRKKMYKSGKSWAIKSTLSLMGGLVLLSFSQGNVVKADSTATGTPVSQATAVADKQSSDDNTVADQVNDGTEKEAVPVQRQSKENLVDAAQGQEDTGSNDKASEAQPEQVTAPETPAQQNEGQTDNPVVQKPQGFVATSAPVTGDDNVTAQDNTVNNNWSLSTDKTTINISGGTLSTANGVDPWSGLDRDTIKKVAFDDNNKTKADTDISGLFSNFVNLTEIDGLTDLDVSGVTDFSKMFQYDASLKDIDISNWDWSHGEDFSYMFNTAHYASTVTALSSIKMPNTLSSSAVTDSSKINYQYMFENDKSVKSLDISMLDMSKITNDKADGLFDNSTGIEKITLSSKNNLINSGLNFDTEENREKLNDKIVAWKNISSPDKDIETRMNYELTGMYDGKTNNGDSKTWQWDIQSPMKSVTFNYVAEDNSSVVFKSKTFEKDSSNEPLYPDTNFRVPSLIDSGVTVDGYDTNYPLDQGATVVLRKDKTIVNLSIPRNLVHYEIHAKHPNGNDIIGVAPVFLTSADTINDDTFNSIFTDKNIVYADSLDSKFGSSVDHFNFYDKIPSTQMITADIFGDNLSPMTGIEFLNLIETNIIKPNIESYYGGKYIFNFAYADVPDKINHSSSAPSREVEGIEEKIGTYLDAPDVQLYDDSGSELTDRKLTPDSDWSTDESMSLDGVKYYRVATNQWVKASDVYPYYLDSTDVRVNKGNLAKLVTPEGKLVTDRELQADSDWYTDRYIYINNAKYYRVATNEFVSAGDVEEY